MSSVYVGGGTPSLLPKGALERLLAAIHASYTIPQETQSRWRRTRTR